MKKILSEFLFGNSCAVRALVAHLLPSGENENDYVTNDSDNPVLSGTG